MKKQNYKAVFLLAVLVFVCAGVYLMTQTGVQSNAISNQIIALFGLSETFWVVFIIRKTAHIVLYSTVFLAIFGVLRMFLLQKYSFECVCTVAFIVGLVLAGVDEIHQMSVPGRQGSVVDMLIDAIGLLVGFSVVRMFFYFQQSK